MCKRQRYFARRFAALTSWFFWGEKFFVSQGIGAGLILGGMVLAAIGEARAEAQI
jgi:drug/metabolite transporter (DMT)-like permease